MYLQPYVAYDQKRACLHRSRNSPPFTARRDRLRINGTGCRLWVAPSGHAYGPAQALQQPVPDTGIAPRFEALIDGAPRRQIVRQQAPGAARSRLIKNRINKFAFLVFGLAAQATGTDVGFDDKPLLISQISGVCKALHAQSYI